MGTISLEHGVRLFWLGRYTERAFTTLKALEKQYDSMIDNDPMLYKKYLECFGLEDSYGDMPAFVESFLFDRNNSNSVAYSLEKAYDNGILIREDISSEALSFLQLAKDTLKKAKDSQKGLLLSLLPLKDLLFAFWGCINDCIYDSEIRSIIMCGKYVERLDLYLRMRFPFSSIEREFIRLREYLERIPENTPYRYNPKQLLLLTEIMSMKENYSEHLDVAIQSLGNLFSKSI